IVIGIFALIGGFGAGGPLPQGLFNAAYWTLGWAAYAVPIGVIFLGVFKLKDEEKELSFGKTASMVAFWVLLACFAHVAFVTKAEFSGYRGGYGGAVGELFGGGTLNAISQIPASIMFLVFAVLALFFAFSIPPHAFTALLSIFKAKEAGDEDLESMKEQSNFTLNEGVPVERSKASAGTVIKNSAQKLSADENHEALTTASDPDWKLPSIDLLNQKQDKADAGDVEGNAETIRESLSNFNINVEMEGANIGPRVTQFTLKPSNGVKLNKLAGYADNLAYDLAATSIRIEAPIPGKRAVGIEVPNVKSATVRLSSVMRSADWGGMKSPLGFAIGKDISGSAVMGALDKMPHLLVAGQTGSGKSVMINTILTSLLYRNSPSDLKLILVDPKQVELKPYDEIPHLLTPVITEPEKCISALKWTVAEMERRYKALSEVRVRNIVEYNNQKKEEGMPYIVVVIDELADLMMMAARDVEALIVRIAQKARAVGIHLILATQRPSVDIITGLIKANVPARIAFTTASQVDSRTIIDQQGAEKLLGQGDMLFLTADMPKPKRVQGALITDDETNKVTDFIRSQREPQYDEEIVSQPVQLNGRGGIVTQIDDTEEPIYKDAVRVVVEGRKASTSLLQRRLRIGYAKAARLIETMEEQGLIGPADGSRPREVLINSMDEVFGDAGQ
ncbi:DNA translocase FtsK, partial [Candidatus Saccharibacteria bacterium]|nr:DNA translocase FtsK [Candidatus Saccharibacteria bacterium]